MPSKKQYNLVNDDAYDCRIPLYNEEAFQHGITFHAKYIGSLDVPRPTSRVEIVAAMRRIRYEFKAKSVKKQKVSLTVSVEGVKVAIRDKKKSNQWPWDENKFILMQHPIYRIFYVSHDSQDLKIFSYIARDGGSNSFKCSVFKSKKKNQAMRIVRTVGQAFEVCHKLSLALASSSACGIQDELECNQLPDASHKGDGASEPNSCDTQVEEAPPSKVREIVPASPLSNAGDAGSDTRKLQNEVPKHCHSNGGATIPDGKPADVRHDIQLLRDQLEQQNQKIITVSSQVQILKDQLSNETSARHQIQAQNEQLLVSNRQLFEQMSRLAQRFNNLEHRCLDRTSPARNDTESLKSPQGVLNMNGTEFSPVFSISNHEPIRRNNSEAACNSSDRGKSSMKHENHSEFGISNSSFGRQLSSSSVTFPISSMNASSRGSSMLPSNASLPGTPSARNFPVDTDHFFKYPSPQNSCLKQSKSGSKVSGVLTNSSVQSLDEEARVPLESRSSYELQSATGFRNRNAENSSSPLFRQERSVSSATAQDGADFGFPKSPAWMDEESVRPPSKSESFIAQVTRDLAKMNSASSGAENSHPSPSYSSSHYTSLFKQS